jgi:hypothetical protein
VEIKQQISEYQELIAHGKQYKYALKALKQKNAL